MLTDEVVAASGEKMKIIRLTAFFALFAAAAACATERTVSPASSSRSVASAVVQGNSQVPLLYVVDGKRLQRDELPALSPDQVSAVRVLKGRAALERYGADAAYGVVIITTKQALAPTT
jgi:outer membrane receptor protein involved in Fe transport